MFPTLVDVNIKVELPDLKVYVYLDMPYATLFQNQFHVNQCLRNIEISIY